MCGIFGARMTANEDRLRETLAAMGAQLHHRGPDQAGGFVDVAAGVALGATRLSIIDLAGGAQPLRSEDGRVWAVINGEIFDYRRHIRELSARGHRFRSHCDSEVVVHAYEEYGAGFVERLDGQFAIALWDGRTRELLLFRDRFGISPLFYSQNGTGALVFASEAKALFASGVVVPRIDPRGVDQVFSLWTNLPGQTCFEGVHEVKPGHWVIVDRRGGVSERRYWSLADAAAGRTRGEASVAEAREALVGHLERAVRERLIADVPVGVYLSGGLDSSVIAAIARREVGPDLRTFSVEFDDPLFDESAHQRDVCAWLDLRNHTSHRITHRDIGRYFPDVVYQAERVLFRTAPVPMYLLSRRVRDSGVKVVLSGEGADEMFWGYPVFKEVKVRRSWRKHPESRWRPRLLERIFPFMPQYSRRYIHLLIDSYRRSLPDSGVLDSHWSRFESCRHQRKFLSRECRDRLGDYSAAAELEASMREELGPAGELQRAELVENATLLAGYLLCSQGDRMTMAHSVEARFPYLDTELAAWAYSLPDTLKLFGLKDKWILRKSFANRLPPAIASRAKHPYQAPDITGFFYAGGAEAECVADALSRSAIERRGLFDADLVEQLLRKARSANIERFGTQDNMALVQVLSAQLLSGQYEEGFARMRRPPLEQFRVVRPAA